VGNLLATFARSGQNIGFGRGPVPTQGVESGLKVFLPRPFAPPFAGQQVFRPFDPPVAGCARGIAVLDFVGLPLDHVVLDGPVLVGRHNVPQAHMIVGLSGVRSTTSNSHHQDGVHGRKPRQHFGGD
jgi:hypothetical protein